MSTGTPQNYYKAVTNLLFNSSDSEEESDEEGAEEIETRPHPAVTVQKESDKVECGTCFDEYSPSEITRCYANHAFCLTCAKLNAETELGKHRWVLQCMATQECEADFPRREMLRFVEARMIAALDKIKLDAALKGVGVNDLIAKCPYCEYIVICGTTAETTEVVCTNPACLKSSCRSCGQELHPDMSCEDYSKRNDARLAIEEIITRAIIRTCNQCATPFIKQGGCNHITCVRCGNNQCYLCSENISRSHHDHFRVNRTNGKLCAQFDDEAQRNQNEIDQAREHALHQFGQDDPGINLKGLQV